VDEWKPLPGGRQRHIRHTAATRRHRLADTDRNGDSDIPLLGDDEVVHARVDCPKIKQAVGIACSSADVGHLLGVAAQVDFESNTWEPFIIF
jgi:hypothetical protein